MLPSLVKNRQVFRAISRLAFVSRPSARDFGIMAAAKRKRTSADVPKEAINGGMPPNKRRASARNSTTAATAAVVNPDINGEIIDAPNATRASPDSSINEDLIPGKIKVGGGEENDTISSKALPKKKGRVGKAAAAAEVGEAEKIVAPVGSAATSNGTKKNTDNGRDDPEADELEEENEEEVKEALLRPPPVNSDYLPLPWTGRLGYACLNTYLRNSTPPVFSSRTCRIQSILEHRHPLQDPNQPEHPTKNRPDKNKPADVELGKRYVESLGVANVKDIMKMVRWNDKYNIKFFRLSSEMFPFASHPEYGYKLAPFASEALEEAGKVIAELGHRVTTHPGQFTQLGSPRKPVIDNAIRDLEYHDEMLSLLKLPEQLNKDAVMILHMGGMFEGKPETLQRFRENYVKLSQGIKNRLVLENCDMGWSVHDLLPICEELNIPFVLDFHHHNIVFDSSQIREGSKDIIDLFPRIKATWDRKGITQKMHYSEPTPAAITPRQRRKHNPRVASLPPCPPNMDLMIEAKDKEQAVFELMKTFKLPGFDRLNDVVPYVRSDDNKLANAAITKKSRSKKKDPEPEAEPELIPDEEVGMGGPDGRVYWPPGMEEWLRPKKRDVKKKDEGAKDLAKVKKEAAEAYAAREAAKKGKTNGKLEESSEEHEESDIDATPATKKAKAAMRKKLKADEAKAAAKSATATPKTNGQKKKRVKKEPSPLSAASEDESELTDFSETSDTRPAIPRSKAGSRQSGGRAAKKRVSYIEADDHLE